MIGSCPVIILHGWGAQASRWDQVKLLLEQKGFQVFVPDLPGFGKEPDPPDAWGLAEYANWVVRWAQKHSLEKFALVGHSFGGSVAVELAANYPGRLERLLLVNSAGIRRDVYQSRKGLLWLGLVHLGDFIFNLPVLRICRKRVRWALYRLLKADDYFKVEEGTKKEILRKIVRQDVRRKLEEVTAPTLIIWGDRDRVTPVRWAKIFKDGIPRSQLKIVRGAGHVFPYYESEKFVDLVTDFLKA